MIQHWQWKEFLDWRNTLREQAYKEYYKAYPPAPPKKKFLFWTYQPKFRSNITYLYQLYDYYLPKATVENCLTYFVNKEIPEDKPSYPYEPWRET